MSKEGLSTLFTALKLLKFRFISFSRRTNFHSGWHEYGLWTRLESAHAHTHYYAVALLLVCGLHNWCPAGSAAHKMYAEAPLCGKFSMI